MRSRIAAGAAQNQAASKTMRARGALWNSRLHRGLIFTLRRDARQWFKRVTSQPTDMLEIPEIILRCRRRNDGHDAYMFLSVPIHLSSPGLFIKVVFDGKETLRLDASSGFVLGEKPNFVILRKPLEHAPYGERYALLVQRLRIGEHFVIAGVGDDNSPAIERTPNGNCEGLNDRRHNTFSDAQNHSLLAYSRKNPLRGR